MAVADNCGITKWLSTLFNPVLKFLFPQYKNDNKVMNYVSINITANLLGLGNAATPMGIQAAQRLAKRRAADELCRLIVLNTASIQLIPATVAALRASLGCATPFDILPAVWVTSMCSAGMGVLAACIMGRLWRK